MKVPKCRRCNVEQPWLLEINTQVMRLTYQCENCGTRQSVVVE